MVTWFPVKAALSVQFVLNHDISHKFIHHSIHNNARQLAQPKSIKIVTSIKSNDKNYEFCTCKFAFARVKMGVLLSCLNVLAHKNIKGK